MSDSANAYACVGLNRGVRARVITGVSADRIVGMTACKAAILTPS